MRPPVWIILVLHAELASVRALLARGLDHSNLPSTLELVCDVPYLLHTQTSKIEKRPIQILTNTYRRHTHTHTIKATLCLLPCHQRSNDSALDKKKYYHRDNPGRARSWSGRLKLSFRAVWDSARMPGLPPRHSVRGPNSRLWRFHGNVGIRKALNAVSRMLATRVGGHPRGSPRYSYNADSAGLVDGAHYQSRIWSVYTGV